MQNSHESDVITYFIDAGYICVGSPTLNKNLMPSVAKFLTYLKGLSPGGRKAIAFGSYGWGGNSIKQIKEYLEQSKLEVVDSISYKYVPTSEDIIKLREDLMEKI